MTLYVLVNNAKVFFGITGCNTFCPVGTALGYMNKMAFIRPRIHEENCTGCGQCTRHCKASCIDHKNASIDASRCGACEFVCPVRPLAAIHVVGNKEHRRLVM